MGPTAGDRKNITKEVREISGKEGVESDFGNANDCNLLFVVDKGVDEKGVEYASKLPIIKMDWYVVNKICIGWFLLSLLCIYMSRCTKAYWAM